MLIFLSYSRTYFDDYNYCGNSIYVFNIFGSHSNYDIFSGSVWIFVPTGYYGCYSGSSFKKGNWFLVCWVWILDPNSIGTLLGIDISFLKRELIIILKRRWMVNSSIKMINKSSKYPISFFSSLVPWLISQGKNILLKMRIQTKFCFYEPCYNQRSIHRNNKFRVY